jgi:predicted amidohydrolase
MKDKIRVGAVQPPVPEGKDGRIRCVEKGLEFARRAVQAGAKIVCLPEYFGVWGIPAGEWRATIVRGDEVLKQCAQLARRKHVTILCPSLELEGRRLFNTTWVVGPAGKTVGRYRKVHLTLSERKDKGVSPGDDFPVFELGALTFGIMTCYDGYFPESARILALQKAQVLFWPSLQRGETEEVIRLQARSRAFDNCIYVVRSSYGYPKNVAWSPGMMAGLSCIVDYEGRMVSDLGHDEGFLVAEISVEEPRPRRRSFQGAPNSPRRYLFDDRRPRLYRKLCANESS